MSPRRKEEVGQPLGYDEAYRELAARMAGFHISRIAEMPRVELYRDQVISLVEGELAPLYADREKIVTGSMINNYVKQRIVPAPVRKRYTRTQLATIVVICAFKSVLPISQIAQLIRLYQDAGIEGALVFDALAGSLEEALAARFPLSGPGEVRRPAVSLSLPTATGAAAARQLEALLESTVSLVADKVYVEKMLALEALRDRQGEPRVDWGHAP